MVQWKRYGLFALVAGGMLTATVGADLVGSQRLAVAFVLGGSLLAWGSLAVDELVLDNCLCGPLLTDERMQQIYLRASYATWFLLLAVLSTFGLAYDHVGLSVAGDDVVQGVLLLAIVSFVVAMAWHDRRM